MTSKLVHAPKHSTICSDTTIYIYCIFWPMQKNDEPDWFGPWFNFWKNLVYHPLGWSDPGWVLSLLQEGFYFKLDRKNRRACICGFPSTGHFYDSAVQCAGTSSLGHALPRKIGPDILWFWLPILNSWIDSVINKSQSIFFPQN